MKIGQFQTISVDMQSRMQELIGDPNKFKSFINEQIHSNCKEHFKSGYFESMLRLKV